MLSMYTSIFYANTPQYVCNLCILYINTRQAIFHLDVNLLSNFKENNLHTPCHPVEKIQDTNYEFRYIIVPILD